MFDLTRAAGDTKTQIFLHKKRPRQHHQNQKRKEDLAGWFRVMLRLQFIVRGIALGVRLPRLSTCLAQYF